MTHPLDVGRTVYDVAHLVAGALIVAGLWWVNALRRELAHTLIAQRMLADHVHGGRVRFEGSLKALGCVPFYLRSGAGARDRPLLRLVRGGLSRRPDREGKE